MEVGKMPAQSKTKQSRGLTAAGLIAVTAATLLMMAWAIFPTAAFATVLWDGNGVVDGNFKLERCDDLNTPYIFWVFTGDPAPGESVVHLTVNNGAPISMVQQGKGSWHATSPFFDLNTVTASVDGVDGTLTISHGCPGETTTTTTTTTPPEKGRIVIEKQTVPNGDPATFGFTGEITTTLGDGQESGKDVDPGTYTVSETALAGWTLTDITCNDNNSTDAGNTATFNVEPGETVRCVFTNTKDQTTTTTPPEKGRIVIEKQTVPNGDPATFGFTGEITTTLGDGQESGKDVDPGTYTVSETALAGWTLTDITCNDNNSTDAGNTATFNVEAGETVRCVFTNTKDQTTTTTPGGGGGGGGGGTTTTPPPAPTTTPIVAPTTVTNTSTTATDEVLPTTVRPGKLAFTGIEDVVPIGALALTLMTTGSGLLWAGSRRRRHDGSEDED
jgi:Prealbumin-like fold domain